MHPILFSLGPLTLRTYGLLVACAFLVAVHIGRILGRRSNIPDSFMIDLAGVMLVSGLVGARLFYVFLNLDYFGTHPGEVFKIWQGGLVFYGGFLLAAAVGVWYTREKKHSVALVADAAAPALAIGQAIGRLGCFFAGCCYGKPTDFFCAVQFKEPGALAPLGISLHPTQLYETLLAGGLGGYLMWRVFHRRDSPGTLFWYYVLGYGLLRFVLEFLRGDARGAALAGMYPSQWIALFAIVLSSSILIAHLSEKPK